MTAIETAKPFCLREQGGSNAEWYVIVAGKTHGPWPDKGTASAGYATEQRRAAKRAVQGETP